MNIKLQATALAIFAVFAASALAPSATFAKSKAEQAKRQKEKNKWRNAAGAVSGYGLLKGNKAATVLGAAGAA